MFKSTGIIVIEDRFMFLQCDPSISKYYRRLSKRTGLNLVPQRHDSHISVVRTEELDSWQILPTFNDGMEVEFCGNPEYIQNNKTHYWFRIISPGLEELRISMGFCSQPIEVFEDGTIYTHPFHLTIGRIDG